MRHADPSTLHRRPAVMAAGITAVALSLAAAGPAEAAASHAGKASDSATTVDAKAKAKARARARANAKEAAMAKAKADARHRASVRRKARAQGSPSFVSTYTGATGAVLHSLVDSPAVPGSAQDVRYETEAWEEIGGGQRERIVRRIVPLPGSSAAAATSDWWATPNFQVTTYSPNFPSVGTAAPAHLERAGRLPDAARAVRADHRRPGP